MIRHIRRNILKRRLGTNDISQEWHQLQILKWQKKMCKDIGERVPEMIIYNVHKKRKRKHKRRRQGK